MIRKRLDEARAAGLIDGSEPVFEQLEKAGLLNSNRGRDEARWVQNLELEDFIEEFNEILDINTPLPEEP